MKAECIWRARAEIGEGSLWDEKTNRLYWVDIPRGELHRFSPAGGSDELLLAADEPLGTVVLGENGTPLGAWASGLYHVADGRRTLLTPAPDPRPTLRFNDGKCDPVGRLWVGTMTTDNGQTGTGNLYRVDGDQFTPMVRGTRISNGIVWSPDRRTMYYADTPEGVVWAFDYEEETGAIANRRTIVTIDRGGPDGMTIDSEGMLWVAQWGGSQVGRWNPATGQKLAQVDLPAVQVSSCAFGGPGLAALYITTAAIGTDERAQPLAGSLFAVETGTTGLPAFRYRG